MSAPASRFFSVPARYNGRVVCRLLRWSMAAPAVWAWRAPRAGQRPSPACLFLPASSRSAALRWAEAAARCGFVAQPKPAAQCACWASGPLAASAPAWACKVRLPPGVSPSQARASIWPVHA